MFLPGTSSKEKGCEAECIDRYIKKGASEEKHFEVCSPETWVFLSKKYGFDYEVKRYYKKGQQWNNSTTSLELKMKLIPIVLVFEDQIKNIKSSTLKHKYVQVRKTSTYSDLKLRIADCCTKLKNSRITKDQVRLW